MSKNRFLLAVLFTLTLLLSFSQVGLAQSDPGNMDTVRVTTTQVNPDPSLPVKFGVRVTCYNDEVIYAASLGFYYGAGDVTVDSISVVGSSIAHILTTNSYVQPANRLGVIGFVRFFGNGLLRGDSLLSTIWFTLAPGAPNQTIDIDSGFFPPAGDFVLTDSGGASIRPYFKKGQIIVGTGGAQAVLAIDSSSLGFNAVQGGSNPAAKNIMITNAGTGTLSWIATKDSAWLSLSSYSGTAPSSISVSANITGLAAGTYKDTITVSSGDASNSPQKVAVTLIVAQPPPVINLSQALFEFVGTQGVDATLKDTLTITNAGGGSLNWGAAETAPWLSVNPGSGTAPSNVEVAVTTNGLTAAIYETDITISAVGATNSPQNVHVKLTINPPPPQIFASPSAFVFDAIVNTNPADQNMNISNTGGGSFSFTLSHLSPWLTTVPGSGTVPPAVDVALKVNTAGMVVGTYKDTIVVSAAGVPNSPVKIPVVLNVLEPEPFIVLDKNNIIFTIEGSGIATDQVNITNGGGGTLDWSAGNLSGWLKVNPPSGTAPSVIGLEANSDGLAIGDYYDTVTVDGFGASNSPQLIYVKLSVVAAAEFIITDNGNPVTSISFEGTVAKSLDPIAIHVASTGTAFKWMLNYKTGWLSAVPDTGTTPSDIQVAVNIASLTPGTYYDTITFSRISKSATAKLEVVLHLNPPAAQFAINPDRFDFLAVEGQNPDSQILDINSTSTPLDWSSSVKSTWLKLLVASGTTPSHIPVLADVVGAGLTDGIYYDTISIHEIIKSGAIAQEKLIPVTLTVTPAEQPILSVLPLTLSFEATQGGPNPASKQISITNVGTGTLNWTAQYDAAWILLSQNSGTAPTDVQVNVDITGLVPGERIDTIMISAPGAENTPKYIQVTLTVNPYSPQGGDTVWVSHDTALIGQIAMIEVSFENNNLIAGLEIPLHFNPAIAICDSVSFTGTRVEYISTLLKPIDNIAGTINIGVVPTEEELIPVGKGLLAKLYFTGVGAGFSKIDTGFIAPASEYIFVDENVNPFYPDFFSGGILIQEAQLPCIQVNKDEFFFEGVAGSSNPDDQLLIITNCGVGILNWTATKNNPWLTVDPTSGSGGDSVLLSISLSGLAAGTYEDSIRIADPAASNSPVFVKVHLTVHEPGPPMDTVRVATVHVTASPSNPVKVGVPVTLFNLQEIKAASLGFYYTDSPDIVIDSVSRIGSSFSHIMTNTSQVNPALHLGVIGFVKLMEPHGIMPGDSLLATMWFTINAGAAAQIIKIDSGFFPPAGDFVLTDNNGYSVIPFVKSGKIYIETENPEIPDLAVAPDSLLFEGDQGGANPPEQTVFITNAGTGTLTWEAIYTTPWLSALPNSGTAPSEMKVSVDLAGLTQGSYVDSIKVAAVGALHSPHYVKVVLHVNPPPVMKDSVWVSAASGCIGDSIAVPIYFKNEKAINGTVVPLIYGFEFGDENGGTVSCISVSFAGSRIESLQPTAMIDSNYVIINSTGLVNAGNGLLATMYFDFAGDVETALVAIDTATLHVGQSTYSLQFTPFGGGALFVPGFTAGSLSAEICETGLAGTVIDDKSSDPIADAKVDIYLRKPTMSQGPSKDPVASTMTDADGKFAFPNLADGEYVLRAYKHGYYPTMQEVDAPNNHLVVELKATGSVIPTYEWVNFYCDLNYLNDILVQAGDVIEAFNPTGVLCGQWFVTEEGKYGFMPVYRDDEYTPNVVEGCVPGDHVSFKINGYAAQTSAEAIWTENGDNFEVCLNAKSIVTECIPLHQGWNLISWNLDTEIDDVDVLIADIKSAVDVILGFEVGAQTYDPLLPQFNTLYEMDHFHGYWFRMKDTATLCVTGVPVNSSTPIALEMNWNLVSYLPNEEDSIESALNSIMDDLIVVLGFENGGLSYDPDLGEFSTLHFMKPNFGYWIKVTENVMLTYPANTRGFFLKAAADQFTEVGASSVIPTNVWINLYGSDVTVDGNPLAPGTILEAVDLAGNIYGLCTVSEAGKFGFMPVYGAENGSATGLKRDDQFSIRVNDQLTNEMFTFSGNGDRILVGSLSLKSGGTVIPNRFNLSQNYPNPFNPNTTIFYDLPQDCSIELSIYNILGERVVTLVNEHKTAGSYRIEWNGTSDDGSVVSSGIYFYRLNAGDYVESKKMTLMK